MDDDGEGMVDPLVTGVYRLDQLVCILCVLLPPLFEQMLAKQNSRELALHDGSDASERHAKARIEVLTCKFDDQSEVVAASGSDESIMRGSSEFLPLRRLSEESDHGTLPRHVSEL